MLIICENVKFLSRQIVPYKTLDIFRELYQFDLLLVKKKQTRSNRIFEIWVHLNCVNSRFFTLNDVGFNGVFRESTGASDVEQTFWRAEWMSNLFGFSGWYTRAEVSSRDLRSVRRTSDDRSQHHVSVLRTPPAVQKSLVRPPFPALPGSSAGKVQEAFRNRSVLLISHVEYCNIIPGVASST